MKKRPRSVDGNDDAPPDRHRILIGAQDSARSMLVKLLGDAFETIHHEIGSEAGSAHANGVRTAITRRAKITRAALDRLDRFWADFALGIPLPAVDELLTGDVAQLADNARRSSSPAYDRLAKRMVELHTHADGDIDCIPLDPAYLVLTFREALEEHGIDAPSVLAMMSAFDLEVLQRLGELYDTLSRFLADCGIRPDEPVPDVEADRPRRETRRAELAPPPRDQASVADQSTRAGSIEPATPDPASDTELAERSTMSEPPTSAAAAATTEEATSAVLSPSTGSFPEGDETASPSLSSPASPERSVAGEEGHHEAVGGPDETRSSQGSASGKEAALAIGSWVVLHIGDGPDVRAKLSWRSPQGKMLFVDVQGRKVAQLGEEEVRQALRAQS